MQAARHACNGHDLGTKQERARLRTALRPAHPFGSTQPRTLSLTLPATQELYIQPERATCTCHGRQLPTLAPRPAYATWPPGPSDLPASAGAAPREHCSAHCHTHTHTQQWLGTSMLHVLRQQHARNLCTQGRDTDECSAQQPCSAVNVPSQAVQCSSRPSPCHCQHHSPHAMAVPAGQHRRMVKCPAEVVQ